MPMLGRGHIPHFEGGTRPPEILAIVVPERNGGARPIHAASNLRSSSAPTSRGVLCFLHSAAGTVASASSPITSPMRVKAAVGLQTLALLRTNKSLNYRFHPLLFRALMRIPAPARRNDGTATRRS